MKRFMRKYRIGNFEMSAFELLAFAVSAWLLTACSNVGPNTQSTTPAHSNFGLGGGTSTTYVSGSSASMAQIALQPTAPLHFEVTGVGNHARHICVPAESKLVLK